MIGPLSRWNRLGKRPLIGCRVALRLHSLLRTVPAGDEILVQDSELGAVPEHRFEVAKSLKSKHKILGNRAHILASRRP